MSRNTEYDGATERGDGDAADDGGSASRVGRRGFLGGVGSLLAATAFSRRVTADASAVDRGDDSATQTLASPDGSVEVTVDVSDGVPSYSVAYDGTVAVEDSALGFEFQNQPAFGEGVAVTGSERDSVDRTWTPVWDQYDEIREHYRELRVGLRETGDPGRRLTLAVRAFDDGVGFRYVFPEDGGFGDFAVSSENTEFAFADDYTSWWIRNDFNSYEYEYNETPLSDIGEKSPSGGAHTPVTMAGDDLYLSVHEADLVDYASMSVAPASDGGVTFESVLAPLPDGTKVTASAPHQTPWRTIQVGERPGDLIESNLIVNLNEPLDPEDFPHGTDWIAPQKFLGIWWLMITGRADWEYKGPQTGNHGAQTERMKQYMAFASEQGIPSVLVEGWNEGWSTYPGSGSAMDFDDPYPDFDWDAVTEYGRSLDPSVAMTAHNETSGNITNYESQLDDDPNPFADYENRGINSIKTGYVADNGVTIDGTTYNHHCQPMVNHHHLVYREAAKHRQMLEVHEPIKPTGERRSYPNVMTREGVLGQEYDSFGNVSPSHHVTFPFTRMLGGPVEYTPGIFDMGSGSGGIETTRAKQLAMYPTYFSGLQMVADVPSAYLADREPTVAVGGVAQAEHGRIDGVPRGTKWAGAQGCEYVAVDPNRADVGAAVTWTVEGVDSAGEYALHLRYASDAENNAVPAGTARTATVAVNGSAAAQVTVPPTEYWDEWGTVSATVSLDAGDNDVSVTLADGDTGGFNLDAVAVTHPGRSMPDPDTDPIRGPTVDEFEFVRDVPAAGWDDTRVLDAAIGDYTVTARRHGEEWYVGAMTGTDSRVLDVPLDFLDAGPGRRRRHGWDDDEDHDESREGRGHGRGRGGDNGRKRGHAEGAYVAEIYTDGPDARYPGNLDDVAIYERLVEPSDELLASVARSGGQALRLRPAAAEDLDAVESYERPSQTYSGGTVADTAVVEESFLTVSGTNDGNVVGGEELAVVVDGSEAATEVVRFAPGTDSYTFSFSLPSTGTYDVEVRTPEGETVTSGTVEVRLTDGERVTRWTDPVGDDHGPGSYTYPTGDVFEDGVFDLTEVTLYEGGGEYELIYRVDGPITNPWGGEAGYSLQLLQLYVRDPAAEPDAPSSVEGRVGTHVTFEEPYHYRVVAGGNVQTAEAANGDTVSAPVTTDVIAGGDAIRVTFPKSAVGGSLDGAEVAVLLFGSDGYQPGHIRRVHASNSTYFFGGGRDDEMDPTVVDMVTGEFSQSEALSYSAEDRATLPYIPL